VCGPIESTSRTPRFVSWPKLAAPLVTSSTASPGSESTVRPSVVLSRTGLAPSEKVGLAPARFTSVSVPPESRLAPALPGSP
jgi:hypothetical protein